MSRDTTMAMVSGWSYPAEVFAPLRRQLSGRRVSACDWRQFATTWLSDEAEPAPEAEPSVWVGWSLGGALLLEALRRGRIRPGRVVLLNATPRFLADDGWPGVAAADWRGLRRAAVRQPEVAVAAFRRRFGLPDVAGEPVADVAGLDWLAQLDLRALLADVVTPIDVWLAPDDPLVPAGWPSRLVLSQQVSVRRFGRAGHAAWWHDPADLAAHLSRV